MELAIWFAGRISHVREFHDERSRLFYDQLKYYCWIGQQFYLSLRNQWFATTNDIVHVRHLESLLSLFEEARQLHDRHLRQHVFIIRPISNSHFYDSSRIINCANLNFTRLVHYNYILQRRQQSAIGTWIHTIHLVSCCYFKCINNSLHYYPEKAKLRRSAPE